MAQLLCSAIQSLDGYVADEAGDFSWSAPDQEVHAAVNEQQRFIGTHLYGRRMYDIMRFWESPEAIADISIAGPTIAAAALEANLVDELSFYVTPIVVGGGLRALPAGYRRRLELLEQRTFGNGVVFLRYRPR